MDNIFWLLKLLIYFLKLFSIIKLKISEEASHGINWVEEREVATRMVRESFSFEELENIKKKGVDNYGK